MSVSPFRLTVSDLDGPAAILKFENEMDLACIEEVRERFEQEIDRVQNVIFDLSELTFLDSSGIAFFVTAVRRHGRDRLSFIPSESPNVSRVLEVTGISTDFSWPPLARREGSLPEDAVKGPEHA